jgi:hypothetical protein
MSEYVQITSSPAELMGIASQISGRGQQLSDRVKALNDAIHTHDNESAVYPSDQFSDPFKAKYQQPTVDSEGKPSIASEAVKDSASYCGKKLGEIGDFIGTAMMNYGATDDQSGADITQAGL